LSDQAPRALAFDRSGSVLAVGDAAGFLVLCDASTGAIRARHATGQGAINDLEMAPDGNLLASVGSDLRIWNLQLGELLRFTPRDGRALATVSFRPGTQQVAFAGQEGLIQLLDLDTIRRGLGELGIGW
jgi:WD40 repeat protein